MGPGAPPVTSGTPKRILYIYGNCQSGVLTHWATQIPEIADRYRVVHLRNFALGPGRPPRTIREEEFGLGTILWEQVGQWGVFQERDKLPPDCHTVKFPSCDFSSLWPLSMADPACANGDSDIVGNRMLIQLMDQDRHPDPWAAYRAADLMAFTDFDRFHTINLHRLRLNDDRSDLKFGSWLVDHMVERRLFWCDRHPTSGTLKELLTQLMAATPLGAPGERERSLRELDLLAREDFLARPAIPVEPCFARALGLRWDLGAAEYGRTEGVFLTPEQYHLDYIRWRAALRRQTSARTTP